MGVFQISAERIAERIADAPLPTPARLRMRQNILVQFGRFIRINVKMLRIVYRHG